MEILIPKISEIETSEGKSLTEIRLETIEQAVEQVLRDNLNLRSLKYRHFVRAIVEEKLNKKVNDESVPRAIRVIQNTKKLYLPEVEDNRRELETETKEYYSK